MKFELWPHQKVAVERLRENFRRGVRRQMLCSPTGSGKTIIALYIISEAVNLGSRAWFLCDRRALVSQTSGKFHENGIRHGVLMGQDSRRVSGSDILVCSIQTLNSRGFEMKIEGLFDEMVLVDLPDLIVYDEAHIIWKKALKEILERNIPMIGLSATPMTPGLDKWYEEIVNVTTVTELISQSYLSKLVAVFPDVVVDTDNLDLNSEGEFNRAMLGDRVRVIIGDVVPEWEKNTEKFYKEPVQTIVFAADVVDTDELVEKFRAAGHDFVGVHYKNPSKNNQQIIDRYREGKHMGLVSCAMLTRGFDAPATRMMVDCQPQRKSFPGYMQKLGRVMRISGGKDFAVLQCHSNNWIGYYDATMQFFDKGVGSLPGGRKMSKTIRRERKPRDRDNKCRKCNFAMPQGARQCPSCGHKAKPKRSNTVNRSGKLDGMDYVDGRGRQMPFSDSPDDWWTEICAIASRMTDDDGRARRIAYAKFHGIFKRGPGKGFYRVNRDPHPDVDKYDRNATMRWRYAQRKRNQRGLEESPVVERPTPKQVEIFGGTT